MTTWNKALPHAIGGARLEEGQPTPTNWTSNVTGLCDVLDLGNETGSPVCDVDDDDQLASGLLRLYWLPLVALLATMQCTAILLNGLTIGVFLRARLYRSRSNLGLLNLAVADLLMATVPSTLLLVALLRGQWPADRVGCLLYQISFIAIGLASINTVTAIAVER